MNDLYTTAINTQKATVQWMDVLADNLTNVYTPGFRENKVTFKTFLGGAVIDNNIKNLVMEASSEGLLHNRCKNLKFKRAIITNVTGDHLNIHKTFDNYLKSKLKLFTYLSTPFIFFF